MNSLTLVIIALCFFALAYRYYSAFLAARVAIIDPSRPTPAHRLRDGRDYHPTNKIVLFGHHFAAIAGAGPLIGPVLAMQYGYLPGALWILIGSVFAGAVHDFISLFASVRQNGESLSRIAARNVGLLSGVCAMAAIFFIIIVALAGLSLAVVNALRDSAWGIFTIACSIPIAFLMGQWMYKLRPGKVAEASVIGVVLLLAALFLGQPLAASSAARFFTYSEGTLKLLLPAYGFVAAVLPVWMLLCPRDYLSSYLKLGVVALLALGIFIVHPVFQARPLTEYISGGGPIVPGPVWPYVCLTIACGAISGFRSLISSGTTPKMINSEADIRFIGYGAMLFEGFVGIMALVAAGVLVRGDYFAINVPPAAWAKFGIVPVHLNELSRMAGENLAGRTGGAVSLAAGMSYIFGNIPGMRPLMAIWYHFAIVFEALFILTTVDTGTRVARFILQEILGGAYKRLRTAWMPGVIVTSGLVVLAWGYLLSQGTISTIWPMFGVANQLLATLALAIGTTLILRSRPARYALVTFLPFLFMSATVFTGGIQNLLNIYIPGMSLPDPAKASAMTVNAALTVIMLVLAAAIILESVFRWARILFFHVEPAPQPLAAADPGDSPTEFLG